MNPEVHNPVTDERGLGSEARYAMVASWRSMLPSILAIGLLIITTALLIAGYGVPVGIGFAVGLVLGTIATTLLWVWVRAGAGSRSVSVGSLSYLTSDPQPNLEDLERYRSIASRVAAVEFSPLGRVLPIGQSATIGGVRVELIALELREAGGLIPMVVESAPPNPAAGSYGEMSVTDDVGTTYVAAIAGSATSAPGWTRTELRFGPAPPEAATAITVRIEEFVEPFATRAGSSARLTGPWEFLIPLR